MKAEMKVPVGIPLVEVGQRLRELEDAIEKHDMRFGAQQDININLGPNGDNVLSATLTVYFVKTDSQEHKCETCKHNNGPHTCSKTGKNIAAAPGDLSCWESK